jgi:esterase/lipase superfamily enzyme
MRRAHHRWHSPALGRDMEMLVFGHSGPPVIVFPSSMGAFFEYEDRGMVAAVADKLTHGRLQLYCVSSVDQESWYNKQVHPRVRVARHLQYERFIIDEVVPFARSTSQRTEEWHGSIGTTGCSFGGYHALVLGLRRPDIFGTTVTMGGAFDLSQFLDGYYDDDCYFLNPTHFIPHLGDPALLEAYRRNKWVLVTGEHDICRAANEAMSRLLDAKGIPHSLHVWGHGSKHDWPDWVPMAAAYLP